MAGGGEFRHESLYYGSDDYIAASSLADLRPSRNIGAVFAEASVPILKSLTSSLQARWEHYAVSSSDATIDGKTFSKLTPRLGLAWKGPDRLILRASWGRSFKAPSLADLAIAPVPGTYLSPQYDPIQQQASLVYFDSNSNPNLKPEQGETVAAGFTWSPPEADGLQIAANYNRTRFSDQILSSLLANLGTLSVTQVLANPNLFPGVAVRSSDGTLLRVEDGPINVSSVTVRTVDFNVNYDRPTAWGLFSAAVQGIVTLSYDQHLLPLVPVQDLAGTSTMDKRRARLSLGWSRNRYGLNLYANYTGSYLDTDIINLSGTGLQVRPLAVASRTTWDMSGFYEARWGIKFSGGVKDMFSAKFPLAQGFDGPYDTRRLDLRGRVIHAELQKAFNF
jgi:iron complex outermembrane receptor protein